MHITHIDGDQDCMVIGSRNVIRVLHMETRQFSEVEIPVYVYMLAYRQPTVFVVGGSRWPGLKIVDVTTGHTVRHVNMASRFRNIYMDKNFITLSALSHLFSRNIFGVTMLDIEQLLDTGLKDEELWEKRFEYQVGVHNKTKLVSSKHGMLYVLDFWRDSPAGVMKTEIEFSKCSI